MDPELVKQLNNCHARGIAASAVFDASISQGMAQLSFLIASGNHYDNRLMNGFLASQLFDEGLVRAKSAYHTPVEPAAAPLPSPPAK